MTHLRSPFSCGSCSLFSTYRDWVSSHEQQMKLLNEYILSIRRQSALYIVIMALTRLLYGPKQATVWGAQLPRGYHAGRAHATWKALIGIQSTVPTKLSFGVTAAQPSHVGGKKLPGSSTQLSSHPQASSLSSGSTQNRDVQPSLPTVPCPDSWPTESVHVIQQPFHTTLFWITGTITIIIIHELVIMNVLFSETLHGFAEH